MASLPDDDDQDQSARCCPEQFGAERVQPMWWRPRRTAGNAESVHALAVQTGPVQQHFQADRANAGLLPYDGAADKQHDGHERQRDGCEASYSHLHIVTPLATAWSSRAAHGNVDSRGRGRVLDDQGS